MRVFQTGAGCFAVILENQNVPKAPVSLKIVDTISKCPPDLLNLLFVHLRQREIMFGRFDDDLMRADSVHLVVDAVTLAAQIAFDSKNGELIRNHTNRPPGLIGTTFWAI